MKNTLEIIEVLRGLPLTAEVQLSLSWITKYIEALINDLKELEIGNEYNEYDAGWNSSNLRLQDELQKMQEMLK